MSALALRVKIKTEGRVDSDTRLNNPPISACSAEGGRGRGRGGDQEEEGLGQWNYYIEVDAQNRFMGNSFEIHPAGVAHVELRIPRDWFGGGEGKLVTEHCT